MLVSWLALGAPARAQEELTIDKIRLGASPCLVQTGVGSPEGVVIGRPCDLYLRIDGSTFGSLLYIKASGASTTGWVVGGTVVLITDDTTTNATMYPTWVSSTGGSQALKVSGAKLSWNPSTGTWTTDTLVVANGTTFGSHALPSANYSVNLGSPVKKYLTINAAELLVETLVAQQTQATIGGRVLVGETTVLTSDLAAGATSMATKHNALASGDRVRLEANGQLEWLAVTSAPSGQGPYTYTITRDLDGTGANNWVAGDAVFNTGTTGDGFIDLYATTGVVSGTGPTIVGNVRTGTAYNALEPRWAIGNLNGLFGYASDTPGAAFGSPSAAWLKVDPTNGLRMGKGSNVNVAIAPSGTASLTDITAATITLGSGGYVKQGQAAYNTGTGFWLGDVSGTPKFSIGNGSTDYLTWDGTTLSASAATLDLSAMPYCALSRITSDTGAVPYDSTLTIPWNNEVSDTFGMHDTGTNPERVTVPTSGLYFVALTVTVYEPSNAGPEHIGIHVLKNGSTKVGTLNMEFTLNNEFLTLHTSTMILLAANDYLEAVVGHQGGPDPGTLRVSYLDTTTMTVTKIH